jgi:geranylgeranyl pyrophosphate synthase
VQLEKVLAPILGEMDAVERELEEVAARVASSDGARSGGSGMLAQISRQPFAVSGRRLRPALVLLASRSADDNPSSAGVPPRAAAVRLAAAVEVLHMASLVHDDIIDGAEERRHQVSLNKRYGNSVAVLAGDILYTEFFSLITELPVGAALRSRLLAVFLGATRKMCVGEILAQEALSHGGSLRFEDYVAISEYKTAAFFASCCEGGGLVGGSGADGVGALREFGLLFGLTFQMLDDLVDRDHGLAPEVDLRGLANDYAIKARAAAAAFGRSFAEVSGLLDYVMAQ